MDLKLKERKRRGRGAKKQRNKGGKNSGNREGRDLF